MSSRQKYIEDVCKSNLQSSSQIPHVRSSFYLKSYALFAKLHSDVKQHNAEDIANHVAKEYGKVLKEYVEYIEQWFYDPLLKIERQSYLEISNIWSLCELLYFTEINNDDISKILMTWFNENNQSLFYEYDKQAIYNHAEGSFEHPDFWSYAIRMALLGQLPQLASLLKHALLDVSLSRFNDILAFIIEVRNIIMEAQIDTSKLNKAMRTLRQMNFTDKDTKKHADQLYHIMAILIGDEAATIQHACTNIHAFISTFYYTQSNNMSVHTRAKLFFSKYPQLSGGILSSLLVGNHQQAIQQSVQFDWWFLAHLTDLFHIKHLMDRPIEVTVNEQVFSLDVKDHFILYYASFIKNSLRLWREAFGYMLSCGDLGQELIIEHVKNQDMTQVDDATLDDMADFCTNHSLKETGMELYRAKANYCLTIKDYKDAIKYYIRGDKQDDLDTIFYTIVNDFIMTGRLYDMDSLGPIDYAGPHYAICYGLHRLNTLYMDGNIEAAAKAFMKLIQTASLPDTMMPVIIWEGLKLVEGETTSCFSETDILKVKQIWQKFNQSVSHEQFRLFYFYMQKDKSLMKEPSAQATIDVKVEFLNVTGVIFCRALERISHQS